uniref:UFSP1/2/DUB catalytic domain-containing protein n=2 Tax=Moniliophthora roreri TaxID=221103 RepID=A0A0W0GCI5_MONRR
MSIEMRQLHYEEHFDESGPDEASTSSKQSRLALKPNERRSNSKYNLESSSRSWRKKGKWRQPFQSKEDEQDVFWYPAMHSIPIPSNFTPGMVTLLKKALLKSHSQSSTVRAVLCYEQTVFINRQWWDATWGCGYRNFLMACAALMNQTHQPLYFPLLDKPISPGIRNLQKWIEEAWKNEFDDEGFKDLRKLVGTRKWIGTSDLCTAFLFRGIPAQLADFEAKGDDIRPLTRWIVQYFDKYSKSNSNSTFNTVLLGATPVQSVPCMPLVLQNDGHSRLVVGYEMSKGGVIHLLIFDPSRVPSKAIRKAAIACYHQSLATEIKPKTRSGGPGQKRRSSGDEDIICLGSKEPSSKRVKGDPSPMVRRGKDSATVVVSDDDEWEDEEIVCLGERPGNVTGEPKKMKTMIEEPSAESLWKDIVKLCRWEDKKVMKKNKYQILYFPMEEPLTVHQRMQRKVLTSERIS